MRKIMLKSMELISNKQTNSRCFSFCSIGYFCLLHHLDDLIDVHEFSKPNTQGCSSYLGIFTNKYVSSVNILRWASWKLSVHLNWSAVSRACFDEGLSASKYI